MPGNDPGGPPPTPPPLLNYRPPRDEPRQPPYWAQAFVGFITCAAATLALNFVGGWIIFGTGGIEHGGPLVAVVCALPLVGFGLFGRSLRRRGRWPGFLVGALLGWGGAALVEGLCFLAVLR